MARSSALFDCVDDARNGEVSDEGGDVGLHGRDRIVTRHVANYLAAVELASQCVVDGPVVDVGCGVGALAAWAAEHLDTDLYLVDHNPDVCEVAGRAFPEAKVDTDIGAVPDGSARLVMAMEVIEHVRPREQAAFVRELASRVAPGGLLVLSTPDETGYVGGWSAYPPHVGTLSYEELRCLLSRNCGDGHVWRLEGGPFELSALRAAAEPVVNRMWGAAQRYVPATTKRVLHHSGQIGRALARARPRVAGGRERRGLESHGDVVVPGDGVWPVPSDVNGAAPVVKATANPDGRGTGLIGAARRPA